MGSILIDETHPAASYVVFETSVPKGSKIVTSTFRRAADLGSWVVVAEHKERELVFPLLNGNSIGSFPRMDTSERITGSVFGDSEFDLGVSDEYKKQEWRNQIKEMLSTFSREKELERGVHPHQAGFVVSPNGKHYALSGVDDDGTAFLLRDGKKFRVAGHISSFGYSANSERFYVSVCDPEALLRKDEEDNDEAHVSNSCFILDGISYDISIGEHCFSPDSKHFIAFAYRHMRNEIEHRYLFINGEEKKRIHGLNSWNPSECLNSSEDASARYQHFLWADDSSHVVFQITELLSKEEEAMEKDKRPHCESRIGIYRSEGEYFEIPNFELLHARWISNSTLEMDVLRCNRSRDSPSTELATLSIDVSKL